MDEQKSQIDYVKHLYSLIQKKGAPSYIYLSRLLHTIPFEWSVRNDDNRIADALEIRNSYIEETGISKSIFKDEDVSVLEILVGIIFRMMYVMYGETRGVTPSKLFVELLSNLKLTDYSDLTFLQTKRPAVIRRDVCTKVDKMLFRRYTKSGLGGLFPLKRISNRTKLDLRKVELWYQMMHYLEENYP